MIGGLDSVMNSYFKYSVTNPKNVEAISKVFDYTSSVKSTQSMLESYKANNSKVRQLSKESADFLTGYTKGMNELNQTAGKLTNGGVDKLLFDREGKVTEDTVKNTVSAVRDMVDSYNSNLKTLNDNADRGPGVTNQMARMVDDPAPKAGMDMVGVSVNKDGTLALDEEALTKALNDETPGQRELFRDIIGGSTGIAAGVQKDARAGLRQSAQSLIGNDLAEMQGIRQNDPIREFAQSLKGGGAYALNNNAAMGILMNMTV